MPETQAPETVSLSAAEAAVIDDNFDAFKQAKNQERLGKPLPAVDKPAKTVDGEAVPLSQPQVQRQERSAKRRELEEAARRTAERVAGDFETQIKERDEKLTAGEARIKALEAELAQAKSAATGKPVGVSVVPAGSSANRTVPISDRAADPEPNPQDLTKYPGGEYDPKFQRDVAAWVARDTYRQQQQAERDRVDVENRTQEAVRLQQRGQSQLEAEFTADPAFKEAVLAQASNPNAFHILNIRPVHMLAQNEQVTALNVLAEEIFRSEHSGKLIKHFHEHPELLTEFANYPNPRVLTRAFDRLEAQFDSSSSAPAASSTAPAPSLKTVTEATPPPTVLGGRVSSPADPVEAAMKADDPRAYKLARAQERQAGKR